MGRKRTCELPFCKGVVEGTRNKRRCDNDRNIHLHQVISKNVRKIMRYIEGRPDFTANDVNRDLFKDRLDKNEKGSMYRLFQAMVREDYLMEKGKREGLKVYAYLAVKETTDRGAANANDKQPVQPAPNQVTPPPQPTISPLEVLRLKLREFVHSKSGFWNHDDWLWLVNRPDVTAFGFSETEIGLLLECEKAGFWAQR